MNEFTMPKAKINAEATINDATISSDVLVIGSGAAGLTAAIALAQTRRVIVLAKGA